MPTEIYQSGETGDSDVSHDMGRIYNLALAFNQPFVYTLLDDLLEYLAKFFFAESPYRG